MKLAAATLIAYLRVASAHTVFTTLFINDVDQGDGTCVRMPMSPGNATYPVNDLTSRDMACGYSGTQGVARVCTAAQGAMLSFQFREYADNSAPGAIDASHKGPCAVYMKPVVSAVEDTAIGGGWFKIAEEGYDNSTSQWCTEKLNQNNGTFDASIPADLAGGYYLVRVELLALHQADKTPPNPQFYIGCAQIFLDSTETVAPSDTVNIPGYTNTSDPAVLFNIYTPKWPYHFLGPTPYISNTSPSTQIKALTTQGEGLLPKNVVAINANWWGIELESYSNSAGCWNASANCFVQATACYNDAPPTGSSGCHLWEAKCDSIQAACNANNFTGPPNKGLVITPGYLGQNIVAAGSGPIDVVTTMTGLPVGYSISSNGSMATILTTPASSSSTLLNPTKGIAANTTTMLSASGVSISSTIGRQTGASVMSSFVSYLSSSPSSLLGSTSDTITTTAIIPPISGTFSMSFSYANPASDSLPSLLSSSVTLATITQSAVTAGGLSATSTSSALLPVVVEPPLSWLFYPSHPTAAPNPVFEDSSINQGTLTETDFFLATSTIATNSISTIIVSASVASATSSTMFDNEIQIIPVDSGGSTITGAESGQPTAAPLGALEILPPSAFRRRQMRPGLQRYL